ncbi:DUF1758 domain-containing protein [Trichonephila clavipes]|nr:DUF1758 domain-containing protein [Trichonephila clavipes]
MVPRIPVSEKRSQLPGNVLGLNGKRPIRSSLEIKKDGQTFDKNDIRNKLEKLELTYTEFDKADAVLPIESSKMEEFETKYYETKAKLQNILEKLSELEEIPNVKDKILTSEEQFVETHFQNTYACNSDGRFVVKLPFYKSNSELGDSKPAAISRLLAIERKFKNNPDFEKQYKEFMNEYESLGHMSLVNSRSHTSKDQNFLPHNAVIKPSSTTTKLRVVFDASLAKRQMVRH